MSEWISIEDALPENGIEFDAWNVNGYRIANYGSFQGSTDNEFKKEVMKLNGITHWMPLPETPKFNATNKANCDAFRRRFDRLVMWCSDHRWLIGMLPKGWTEEDERNYLNWAARHIATSNHHDAQAIALVPELLREVVKHSWISVDDALPDVGDWIITCDFSEPDGMYNVYEYLEDGPLYTHWMPLPSPPEGE